MSAFARFLFVLFVTTPLRGWAMSITWRWFMVATFGLPALNIPQALGVWLVIGAMTHQIDPDMKNLGKDEKDEALEWAKAVAVGVIVPLLMLGTGWVYRQFM